MNYIYKDQVYDTVINYYMRSIFTEMNNKPLGNKDLWSLINCHQLTSLCNEMIDEQRMPGQCNLYIKCIQTEPNQT